MDCFVRLDKTSGSGDSKLNYFFESNGCESDRFAVIRVKDKETGQIVREITIVQEAKEVITYYNAELSVDFRRDDCCPEGEGTIVSYIVPAGKYQSTISQQAADELAMSEATSNGQAYANVHGECVKGDIYYSIEMSSMFTKDDCTDGEPESVKYTVPAGKYTSITSQEEANNQALFDLERNGQEYANEHGKCLFFNSEVSMVAKRNNCPLGVEGSEVTYVVPARKHSAETQAEADALAQDDIAANAQNYANQHGICPDVYGNDEMSKTYRKNDCPSESEGTEVVYVVEADKHYSLISKEDANDMAMNDLNVNGQNYANSNGDCVFVNDEMSETFYKEGCDDKTCGEGVVYTVPYGKYESTVSKEVANQKAAAEIEANGQDNANTTGSCVPAFFNRRMESDQLFSENCTAGTQVPAPYVYVVEAGEFWSCLSQEDADSQAQADIDENGQLAANKYGECLDGFNNIEMSQEFETEGCGSLERPNKVTYTVPYGKYFSLVSQEDANNQAQADINANGQAYANDPANGGGCVQYKWLNAEKTCTAHRDNCEEGVQGSSVVYTVEAGKYTSEISQEDADRLADEDIVANCQAYANANGTCPTIYRSKAYSQNVQRTDCPSGQTSDPVKYEIPAGSFWSAISQADADQKAVDEFNATWEDWVNKYGGDCKQSLFYNTKQTKNFTRNNCSQCYNGSSITVTVDAGEYTSTISQADANAQAMNYINSVGQSRANSQGTCTRYYSSPSWSDTGTGSCNSCVSYKNQKDNAICSSTYGDTQSVQGGNFCSTDPLWADLTQRRCSSGVEEKYQKENNPCSPTYGTYRWTPTGASCSTAAEWACDGAQHEKCASSASAAAGTGCKPYCNMIDGNKYSPTYNTRQWRDDPSVACTKSAKWTKTGEVCVGNLSYLIEKDTELCSPTYNQTRQTTRNPSGDSGCAAPVPEQQLWVTIEKCSISNNYADVKIRAHWQNIVGKCSYSFRFESKNNDTTILYFDGTTTNANGYQDYMFNAGVSDSGTKCGDLIAILTYKSC